MVTKSIPRIIIAAPKGRSGKTTVTMGLLAALTKRGLKVQPYKKGPDYIDPSWMTAITGRPCRNLDSVLMSKDTIVNSFITNATDVDIAIVEGAMGLHDGYDMQGSGSTAQIAKIIKAPVILVVDCTRMTRSVAAMVMGYQVFDKEINIKGVILNKVSGPRHRKTLTEAVESFCKIPVLGYLPKNDTLTIPDRHLGLIPAGESDSYNKNIDEIGKVVAEHVDLDMVMAIAQDAELLTSEIDQLDFPINNAKKVRIGVIHDNVFSFYYPENLTRLEAEGAELVTLNSLQDKDIGQVDALYIGGGFPEMFAPQLEENRQFRESIRAAIEDGLPVYAECGGLMYLGRQITNHDVKGEMVGALPFDVVMEKKPQGHGYTILKVHRDNKYFIAEDEPIRGHEFHNSRLINLDQSNLDFALEVQRGKGIDGKHDGIIYKNVFAAYNHIHSLSIPQWAKNFVKLASEWK